MELSSKLWLIVVLYVAIPILTSLLFSKIKKHDFYEGWLFSFISMILMPIGMEFLGSKELREFIVSPIVKEADFFYEGMRISAFATVFCLGGASFISKIYEAITGEKLDSLESKVSSVEKQADSIGIIVSESVPFGEDREHSKNKKEENISAINTLQMINDTEGGVEKSALGNDVKPIVHNLRAIGAIKSVFDPHALTNRLVLSDIGKRMLERNSVLEE